MEITPRCLFGKICIYYEKTEMSNQLDALRIDDVREYDDDYYVSIDRLTSNINLIAPMSRLKDRDDEQRTGFLTGAVAGTPRGLSAIQRTPSKPLYQ